MSINNAGFGRAFDLGSLKKPAVEIPGDALGIVVTQANLMSEVLPLSRTKVVILACWSPRSAQAQQLLPLLAKMQDENWTLASLDVDAEPEVAQALQVKAVPYAIALIGEQLVPLFESLPPENQIRAVLDKVLALAAERGVGVTSPVEKEEKLEPEEETALAALENNDFATAKAAYQSWLNRSPASTNAALGLAQVELLSRVHGKDFGDVLSRGAVESSNINLQMLCADIEVALGEYQSAFDRLIAVVKGTSGDERKAVREHLVGLFLLIDPADPILVDARKRLASALF